MPRLSSVTEPTSMADWRVVRESQTHAMYHCWGENYKVRHALPLSCSGVYRVGAWLGVWLDTSTNKPACVKELSKNRE